MFELIFLFILTIYFFQIIAFSIGAKKRYPKLADDELPRISVVVAARNEEDNIKNCMESLNKLEYPEDKIEIILVNDHSNDSTGEIIENFIKDKPKFKVLIPNEDFGNVKGKARAIANANNIAAGEIILTTDADCIVSPTWAKTIASYYTPDVAMVCGFTNQFEYNLFSGMQNADFIYLLTVAAGAINIGKPLSCIGNNMSYRKDVYLEIGGYEGRPFSVTEDFQILMAVHKLKKYKIIYPMDVGALVTSETCSDFKTLYWQKKRWGVGGLESDFAGYALMSIGFLTHIVMLLSPFFLSLNVVYLLAFKIILDYFFISPVYKRLGIKLNINSFIAFELYFITYVILLPILLAASKKVLWKGREF